MNVFIILSILIVVIGVIIIVVTPSVLFKLNWKFLKYILVRGQWLKMPVASPFRLKFLKFFQIRYLESQNLFMKPGRAYKAY